MQRWLVYGLLAIIFGGAFALLISQDSGYVLISLGSKTIEMSFWFAVACVFMCLILFWVLFKLWKGFYDLLSGSVSWLTESKSRRFDKKNNQGLLYFIEGDWKAAKKELLNAARLSDRPLLPYLAAARSAFEMGEAEESTFLLQQAEKVSEKSELIILLTRAQIALNGKQFDSARTILERANKSFPSHPMILDHLKSSYVCLQDWQALVNILAQLKSSKQYSIGELTKIEEKAYTGYLIESLGKVQESHSSMAENLHRIWKSLPAPMRTNLSVVEVYIKHLLLHGLHTEARELIVKTLKSQWNEKLVLLFSENLSVDKREQLLTAEGWAREHSEDPVLYLALGKLSRANELWGKARAYLEKSLTIKPTALAYAEMASLLAHLGEHEKSTRCYQKGLELSA